MICPNCDIKIETGIEQCPHCGCHFPLSAKQEREQERLEREQKEREEKARQEQLRQESLQKERIRQEEAAKKKKEQHDRLDKGSDIPDKTKKQAPPNEEAGNICCPHCGKGCNKNASFCKWCGTSLKGDKIKSSTQRASVICPNCGKELKASAKFCNQCGQKM